MKTHLNRHLSRIFVAIASVSALSTSAFAATDTWSGSNGGDWITAGNWTYSTGTGPVATGDSLVFGSTTTGNQTLGNSLTTGINIAGITFNSGTGTFVMKGNSFNLTLGITNNSSNLQTFSETGGLTESVGNVFAVTSAGGISITTGLTETGVNGLTTTVNGTGGTLTLGSLTLNSGATAAVTDTFNGTGNVNITGAITNGSGFANGLTYSGAGTLTLSGANTYTGATSLSSGTININNASALGSGNVALGNGVTLNNTSGAPITTQTNAPTFSIGGVTVNFAGTNNLNLGTGAVSLTSGNNTFTLSGTGSTLTFGGVFTNTTNAANQMTVNGTGNTLVIGGYALNSGAAALTDALTGSANITISGAVTNGGSVANSLNYIGSGTLTLGGTNTYSGLTTIGGGTVKITGTNTSSGTTSITAGTLDINNAGALASGAFTITGGTIDNTSGTAITTSTNNPTTILGGSFSYSNSAGTANNNLNLGTGAYSLTSNPTITLNGAGTLTFGGTLTNNQNGVATLTVNAGTGTTSTSALSITNFALTGSGSTAARQDVIKGSGTVDVTGTITDGVSALSGLTYSGTGTLAMLTSSSTYTGNTVVSSGTLALGASSTPTSGTVTSGPIGTGYLIFSGGTVLALGSAETIANNLAVANDAAGTIGGTQNITFAGNLDLNSSTTGASSHYTTLAITNTGLTTFSGGINLHGDQLTFNNSGNVLINSAITNSGNFLAYSGTGTLTLSSASNTYSAPTEVNQGTIVLGGNAAASGTGVLGNSTGGSVTLGSTSLTGAASLLVNGAYTIGRNINEVYTGGTPNVAPTNTSLTIGTDATGTGASAAVYTGNIALTAASTTLSAPAGGESDFTTGVISNRATFTNNPSLVIGGGGLIKLTGTNTFGGSGASVTITNASTLNLGSAVNTASLGNSSNILIFNNGIFQFTSGTPFDLSATRTLQFNSGGGTIDTNGNAVTFASAIGNSGAGTGGMTLADSVGTGSLTLSAVNTYTGGTTITAGTLVMSGSGTLGSTSGALTVNGGNLNLGGTNQTVGNFGGTGGKIYNNTSGTKTLTIGNGGGTGGTYSGVIEDNTGSGGKVALTKTGSGIITLSGAETYTGATAVNGGTLAVTGGSSLGGTAVTLSGSSGTLQVGTLNSTSTTTIGNGASGTLTINSGGILSFANGISSSTTVDNLTIHDTSNGGAALTLGGSGVINIGVGGSGGSDEIALTGGTGLVANLTGSTAINLNVLTALNGTSQELIAWGATPTGSGSFSLGTIGGLGAGGYTLSLSETSSGLFLNESAVSNAYWQGSVDSSWATGLPGGPSNFTTDSAGANNRTNALDSQTTVIFAATGSSPASYANTTLDGSPTINSLTINVAGVGIGAGTGGSGSSNVLSLAAAGTGITVGASLGTENISANVNINNTQTWMVNSGSTLAVSGNIGDNGAGNGLNKAGTGTLVLSGVNSYGGATSVLAGALNIQSADGLDGTSGVNVSNGAALQLSGGGATGDSSTNLTLNGSGISNGGALENVSGTNTYSGAITLGSATSIGSDSGAMLYLTAGTITAGGNTLTLVGAGNGDISSTIDSGALTMNGTGTWTIDGTNTYTGPTTVNSGTLQLGNSQLGTFGTGSNALVVNGGTVDMNGNDLVVGTLSGTGGTITNNNGGTEVYIQIGSGTNGTFTGSIANGAIGNAFGPGVVDVDKLGSDVITLSGTNSYTGPTEIEQGALNIASNGGLGTSGNSTSSVTVSNGAALQLSGGITTSAAVPVTLTGTGLSVAPNGALENVSGSNTFTGPITLSGASSIGSDSGSTLNLSSTATIGGSGNLTLIGAGNGSIAGAINLGSSSLTENSTGTWTLSGANSYHGTYVTNGTLVYTAASVLSGTGTITLGSTTGTSADLTYGGAGGTISNALSLTGSEPIVLGNSGTGAVVYSATPAITGAAKTLTLGNTTDTVGGSIGGITNGSGATSLIKTGATNSTWILTGTNSYTGTTTINGGVLQVATASALPSGNLDLTGSVSNSILQTQGTLNLTLGTNLTWNGTTVGGGGFSAIGGTLNLNINSGAALSWGSGGFIGTGGAIMAFGSSTSNAQVVLPNNINLNTADGFQQSIYVAKGTGGDSTLLSGVISGGTTPPSVGPPALTGSASGLTKAGAGTLILSNANNSYTGYTSIESGTLVAEASSTIGATPASGSTGYTATGVFGSGYGYYGAAAPSAGYSTIYVGNNQGGGTTIGGVVNPTLMIGSQTVGGSNSISNPVAIDWNNGTGQVFGIGGYSDANATFSGLITLTNGAATGNTFAVTQVATTGTDALNITGGITATNGGNINFANIGAVNVSTTGISNGGSSPVSVTQTGSGTTTFAAANTYTGGTTVSGGNLNLTGSTSATGLMSVGGVSGGLSTATLSGTGTVGGALTTSSANSNVAHLAPGVNTSGTNFGSAGTLTVAGALTIGSGTDLDIDLNTATTAGSNVNDLISVGGSLTIGGSVTVNFNALGTLTPNSDYTLISGATSSTGLLASDFSVGTITGTTDTAHFLVSGNNLEVYFTASPAIQSFTSPSPSPLRIMAGATTTVGATLQNTVASGNNALNVSLSNSSTGGVGSVTSFSGSNPTTIAAASSSTVTGTFTAGSAGTGTWGITNTDGAASNTTTSTGAAVTVYSKSTPSLSTGTATFGVVHAGATVAAQTTNLQNASGTYVAGLQITSLNGLTNTGGSTLIAAGGSDQLSASVNTSTAGAYSQTYSIGTSDDQTIAGWSANSAQSFTVTGQVYSGQGVWTGTGTTGTWGTVAANPTNWTANGGTPGLDSGFTGVDTATFGTVAGGSSTDTVSLGSDSPNLNAINFTSSTTSYTLAQGGTGTVTLSGTTPSINVTAGAHTISAPIALGAGTALAVASTDKLTISGLISGSHALSNTGAGTTILSSATGNSYTGGTTISAGKFYVNSGVAGTSSGTGSGAVTVNGGTLAGSGTISTSAGVTINSGGTLASGDIQSGTSVDGTHLSLYNTSLTVNGDAPANLTFDLGAGTTAGSGYHTFGLPNTNTTYLSLTGSSTINFEGTDSISLVDLTNTTGSNGSLALRLGTPYLLVQAASNTDYLNLVINSGTSANPIYSLSQNDGSVNGYVIGVYTGSGLVDPADSTPISIAQFGADGVTALTPGPNGIYAAPVLYLDGGQLEVVPEPGTWALMVGGLALLIAIQRRRNKVG